MKYTHSASAWMTATIFEEWFHKDFAQLVRHHLRRAGLKEKAVLLLDNCPAHPPGSTLHGGKIRAYFLPPNTTSKIQPLDLGVIASFKRHNRRHLMQKAILEMDIADLMKKVNVKDAVYLGHRAWDDVTPQTIRNCWDKALRFGTTSQPSEEDHDFEAFSTEDIELAERKFLQGLRVSSSIASYIAEWATMDGDMPRWSLKLNLSSSLSLLHQGKSSPLKRPFEYAAALEMFAEFHGAPSITLIHLQDLRCLAGKVQRQRSRQLTLDSFTRTGING